MAKRIKIVEETVNKKVDLIKEIEDVLKLLFSGGHMLISPEQLEQILHDERNIRFSSDTEFVSTTELMINKGIIKQIRVDVNLTVTEIALERDPDELLSDKEREIMSVIRDNPEGITLSEIGYIMGVAFVTIIKEVKRLSDAGLIKKKESKYFPA